MEIIPPPHTHTYISSYAPVYLCKCVCVLTVNVTNYVVRSPCHDPAMCQPLVKYAMTCSTLTPSDDTTNSERGGQKCVQWGQQQSMLSTDSIRHVTTLFVIVVLVCVRLLRHCIVIVVLVCVPLLRHHAVCTLLRTAVFDKLHSNQVN